MIPRKSFFYVRGVTKAPFCERVGEVQVGDRVRFVPEPTNQFDPNAIKVETRRPDGGWLHVGYYPRELCEYILQVAPQVVGVVTESDGKGLRVDFENPTECEIPRQSSVDPAKKPGGDYAATDRGEVEEPLGV